MRKCSSKIGRRLILHKIHHNAQTIPPEHVLYDLLTDSLQHHPSVAAVRPGNGEAAYSSKPVILRLQEAVRELFGFPYSLPVAQGRMAEALLARLLVRNGTVVPTNMAFPTTRLHQELNGARSLEAIVPEAYDPASGHPFKGDLDIVRLDQIIRRYTPRWVPYISVELSVNAVGGQPCSLENLAAVGRLAKARGVRLFLDGTRILENAVQIQQNSLPHRHRSVWEIVREICSYADGLTMSLTKDFPLPIGGLVVFRDAELYHQAFDFVMAMGDGLGMEAKEGIVHALQEARGDTTYILERMERVRQLHEGLGEMGFPLMNPVGGHAVLVDLGWLLPHLDEADFPGESLNRELFERFGLRGAPHLASQGQRERGLHLFRLAVPILRFSRQDIEKMLDFFTQWHRQRGRTPGLKRVFVPPGLSGEFRAWYRPVPARGGSRALTDSDDTPAEEIRPAVARP